ncbi:hypothetical protein F8388_024899 [Cannabis sativa]|uniref:Transposase-associated domain-containing protein n=1 Tax=Cannabis sativa TaxID=3483 RepID=A0A7J6H717_CANSA|nr:hypothetical protein F8388_024899 [Cannabis sativa]
MTYLPIVLQIEARQSTTWQELQDLLLCFDSKVERMSSMHSIKSQNNTLSPTANLANKSSPGSNTGSGYPRNNRLPCTSVSLSRPQLAVKVSNRDVISLSSLALKVSSTSLYNSNDMSLVISDEKQKDSNDMVFNLAAFQFFGIMSYAYQYKTLKNISVILFHRPRTLYEGLVLSVGGNGKSYKPAEGPAEGPAVGVKQDPRSFKLILEYIKALPNTDNPDLVHCPCLKCGNMERMKLVQIREHLFKNGIDMSYKVSEHNQSVADFELTNIDESIDEDQEPNQPLPESQMQQNNEPELIPND